MPMNDGPIYVDKLSKTTNIQSTTMVDACGMSACSVSTSVVSAVAGSHALYNYQGQKWQQIFDYEKVLKQIRSAEKLHLRCKENDFKSTSSLSNSIASNSSGCGGIGGNFSSSATRNVVQVQRLGSQDMHYYGISPKQTEHGIVICNVCKRYYTKMGFNNHMMLQHPTIWNSIPNKQSTINDVYNVYSATPTENKQDSMRETPVAVGLLPTELMGSPTDMSSSTSTSSSLSSPFATVSVAAAIPSIASSSSSRHHKKSTSKTGSGTSGKSRSKSKHHHTSSSSSSLSTEISQNSSKSSSSSSSNSKKSSSTSATTIGTSPILHVGGQSAAGGKECLPDTATTTLPVAALYTTSSSSSSSNSSCSLPTTPKMSSISDSIVIATATILENINTFSPVTNIGSDRMSDSKDKLSSDTHSSAGGTIMSTKKKMKNPQIIGQELIDSSTSSSSSSDFDRNSSITAMSSLTKSKTHHLKVATKPISANQPQPLYDSQLSELDQAVSSITVDVAGRNAVIGNGDNKVEQVNEPTVATFMNPNLVMSNVNAASNYLAQQLSVVAGAVQGCDDPQQMTHNTSDDNSISLTLDDMLDSKFINEILNTAESEMQFDENALDPALQQVTNVNSGTNNNNGSMMPPPEYMQQQPLNKRMRYDDALAAGITTTTTTDGGSEMIAEFPVYQQPQQYSQYETNNLDSLKMYNNLAEQQQQQQLTSIDAMQLQQLLYQQQQQQQQHHAQYDQSGNILLNNKEMVDVCGVVDADQLQKSLGHYEQQATVGTTNSITAAGTTAVQQQQFSVYNVPSLTDDNDVEESMDDMIVPSIIYEITANNQVEVMDQQRQQQVIAEFLTQAGYDNVENMNVLTANANSNSNASETTAATKAATEINTAGSWHDICELSDFDYSKLETVKSLSSSSSSSSSASSASSTESKTIKTESNLTHTKYNDDFYYNVFLYAGMPRPLAMNCFGLVKLPQCAATTFRKHLLTTRKANNSLLSLNGGGVGGINGVVGSNSGSGGGGVARFPSAGNAKQTVGGGTSAMSYNNLNNEFSIGSITITNANNNNINNNLANPSPYSPIEMNFNAATNGATSPVQRSRSKTSTTLGVNNAASNNTLNAATKYKPTTNTLQPICTPSTRGGGVTAMPEVLNAKTIYVNKTASNCNERLKCITRSIIAKTEIAKNTNFTVKKLNDILNGKHKDRTQHQQQLQQQERQSPSLTQQQQNSIDQTTPIEAKPDQPKYSRVQSFYERRRKLLNATSGSNVGSKFKRQHIQFLNKQQQQQQHQQQQRPQKLLKQQLMRTLSDCGINSIVQWKSNGNNPAASNSDLMRVFV